MIFGVSKLDNGFLVCTEKAKKDEPTYVKMIINAGSSLDHINGIAHFLEHKLSISLINKNGNSFIDYMQDNSVYTDPSNIHLSVGKKNTQIQVNIPENKLEEYLNILSKVLTKPVWNINRLEAERRRILIEHHQDKFETLSVLRRNIYKMAFNDEAFNKNILGTEETIKNFTLNDAEEYMNNNYFANNMALIVVGNLPHSKVRNMAKKYFSELPSKKTEIILSKMENTTGKIHIEKTNHNTVQDNMISFPLTGINRAGVTPLQILMSQFFRAAERSLTKAGLIYTQTDKSLEQENDYGFAAMTIASHPDFSNEIIDQVFETLYSPDKCLSSKSLNKSKKQHRKYRSDRWPSQICYDVSRNYILSGNLMPSKNVSDTLLNIGFDDLLNAYEELDKTKFNIATYGPADDIQTPAQINQKFAPKI